jgi:hypothetical protein
MSGIGNAGVARDLLANTPLPLGPSKWPSVAGVEAYAKDMAKKAKDDQQRLIDEKIKPLIPEQILAHLVAGETIDGLHFTIDIEITGDVLTDVGIELLQAALTREGWGFSESITFDQDRVKFTLTKPEATIQPRSNAPAVPIVPR